MVLDSVSALLAHVVCFVCDHRRRERLVFEFVSVAFVSTKGYSIADVVILCRVAESRHNFAIITVVCMLLLLLQAALKSREMYVQLYLLHTRPLCENTAAKKSPKMVHSTLRHDVKRRCKRAKKPAGCPLFFVVRTFAHDFFTSLAQPFM